MGQSKVFERRMSEVLDGLTRSGFEETFRVDVDVFRASKSGLPHRPEELEIVRLERFEGISNPEDETLVLALRCLLHADCQGTYVGPYGKDTPSADAALIPRIPDARPR